MYIELVQPQPRWFDALEVALARPPGTPERRAQEDPWSPGTGRPRRISDDLAWLRQAMDEPERHGLRPLDGSAAAAVWETSGDPEVDDRFRRLQGRGILDAAGFLLHEPDARALE